MEERPTIAELVQGTRDGKYVTGAEAARILGIRRERLSSYIAKGRLAAYHHPIHFGGGPLYIPIAEVEALRGRVAKPTPNLKDARPLSVRIAEAEETVSRLKGRGHTLEEKAEKDRANAFLYRVNHPDKVRDSTRRAVARRRAAARASAAENVSYAAIAERDKWTCHICGKKVGRDKAVFDHLVPISRGGPHVATNIRIAHRVCNQRRGAGRIPAQLLLFSW